MPVHLVIVAAMPMYYSMAPLNLRLAETERTGKFEQGEACLNINPVTWAFIVGEYPPQPGGVADYTYQVANALTASGDTVHIFAPAIEGEDKPGKVQVHRVKHLFRPSSIIEVQRLARRISKPGRLVIQFLPQSFGTRLSDLAFVLSLRTLHDLPLWVMFHEFPIGDDRRQSIAKRTEALFTRWNATLLAKSAKRTLASTSAWSPLISAAAHQHKQITSLPIPSNVPTNYDPAATPTLIRHHLGISATDIVIGHFGTYGYEETCLQLQAVIPPLLDADESRRFLLIGRNGRSFAKLLDARHPHLSSRLIVTGGLSPELLAGHLGLCDVLVQPFGDGVTTRRTSLIAGLGLGIPMVSNVGDRTECFWECSGAVALAGKDDTRGIVDLVEVLLKTPALRDQLREKARELYSARFDLRHTISGLRTHDG